MATKTKYSTPTSIERSYREDPLSPETLTRKAVIDEITHDKLDLIINALTVDNVFVWKPFGPLTIPAGQTVVVDTNLLSTFSRIDYILNFKDTPITVTKSMKLVVQNDSGNVTDMVSERMGGSINIQVSATDDSVDAFIQITNNEAFDLELTFLRAITP